MKALEHLLDRSRYSVSAIGGCPGLIRGHQVLATPDDVIVRKQPNGVVNFDTDIEAVLEYKCPRYRPVHDTVPVRYVMQMMMQMQATGSQYGYFVSWTPKICRVFRVDRDPELIDLIESAVDEFLNLVEAPKALWARNADLLERCQKVADMSKVPATCRWLLPCFESKPT
eukprot:TRINITY_DN894_c0_g2_i1.p2 TRINITY_DN894_c0_g2~~TRINITY_DN894_c0_g2_i1.p2  ORF type:complete len:170 (+),score=12.10 TRINITY_DN894_c0_g2_i1:1136-1645(+)